MKSIQTIPRAFGAERSGALPVSHGEAYVANRREREGAPRAVDATPPRLFVPPVARRPECTRPDWEQTLNNQPAVQQLTECGDIGRLAVRAMHEIVDEKIAALRAELTKKTNKKGIEQ